MFVLLRVTDRYDKKIRRGDTPPVGYLEENACMTLFESLMNTPAAPGYEERFISFVAGEIDGHCDEIKTDPMGNLIAYKRGRDGTGRRLMISVPVDLPALIVTAAGGDGMLRFHPLGEVSGMAAAYTRVSFGGGSGVVIPGEDADLSKMKIDVGAGDADGATDIAPEGSVGVFESSLIKDGDLFTGFGVSRRALVFSLIQVIKTAGLPMFDTYFVFSTQGQLGNRGAKTAAFGIDPDFAVALAVVSAENPVKLGDGAVILSRDDTAISAQSMLSILSNTGENAGIPIQYAAPSGVMSDAGAIQSAGKGSEVGMVGIPVKNAATPACTINFADAEAVFKLVASVVTQWGGHSHDHDHGEGCACGHDHGESHGEGCACGHDHGESHAHGHEGHHE